MGARNVRVNTACQKKQFYITETFFFLSNSTVSAKYISFKYDIYVWWETHHSGKNLIVVRLICTFKPFIYLMLKSGVWLALHILKPHCGSVTALMGSQVIRWNDGKSKYCCFATPDLGLLAFATSEMDCRCWCDVKQAWRSLVYCLRDNMSRSG